MLHRYHSQNHYSLPKADDPPSSMCISLEFKQSYERSITETITLSSRKFYGQVNLIIVYVLKYVFTVDTWVFMVFFHM